MPKCNRGFELLMAFLIMMAAQQAYSHGETLPGPHGGFIRMPGAFHTEVIPQKEGIKVMLLDMDFQHPTVKEASVKATLQWGKQSVTLTCKTEADYFFCPLKNKWMQQKGSLTIVAEREKAQGAKVSYPFPLVR